MPGIEPTVLAMVAKKLNSLGIKYAFVGGSIVGYLLDDPRLSPVRPTDDLDVIIEVLTNQRYSDIEAKLRKAGFLHDTRQGAAMCRWTINGIVIDIMPTQGRFLGLNTAWFQEALDAAKAVMVGGFELRVISPVALIATKLAAFADRGKGDYLTSSDLEDLLTVIDGRASIVEEIIETVAPLREYVVSSLRRLNGLSEFQEALPGYLPSDAANQRRLPLLRRKLESISEIH
jgi:hypothetical protein